MKLTTLLKACLSVICILCRPTLSFKNTHVGGGVVAENYGILLDAGSSSTKLNIYRYSSRNTPVPRINLFANIRFEISLSTFEKDVSGLTLYMESILSRAKQKVPESRHAETPIFLMATAGLRFLPSKNVKSFLENIKSVMAKRDINPFWYMPSNVRILSGEKEGAYAWIAANYLIGFFDKYRPENESFGVLEMGGGSTQITFIPNEPLFGEEYQVVVAGRTFHLYVQSYLQFGSNAIKLKVAHALSHHYPDQDKVNNPCMLRGDTSKTSMLEDGRILLETGTGLPELCLKLLRDILKPHTGIHCHPKPCAIGSVYQPSIENIRFFATQAFMYAPEALKVVGKDQVLHIDLLEDSAFKHCNRSLQMAVNESGISETYASDNCLMGLYIPTLLTLSYRFSRNTTNIKLASSIGKERIDWSLGAMLVELSNMFDPVRSRFTVVCNVTDEDYMKTDLSRNVARGIHENIIDSSQTLTFVVWLFTVLYVL